MVLDLIHPGIAQSLLEQTRSVDRIGLHTPTPPPRTTIRHRRSAELKSQRHLDSWQIAARV